MKILQKNYIRGLPVAVFTTTSISTYTSIKYEMNRPYMLPYAHHIKNVVVSTCIGALTGALYPVTFPLYFSIFYILNLYQYNNSFIRVPYSRHSMYGLIMLLKSSNFIDK